MKKQSLIMVLAIVSLLNGCGSNIPETDVSSDSINTNSSNAITNETEEDEVVAKIPDKYKGKSAEEICKMMTTEEKAAQMVQGAIYILGSNQMQKECYGSVLSNDRQWPNHTCAEWAEIVDRYQIKALMSDTGIPFVYGQDSVHGVNYASDTIIFPQNINIGAANDAELTYEMGKIVGSDLVHTKMLWNFAPCVAMSKDPRWGRTYESYSSENERVKSLSVQFSKGLMTQNIAPCAKHFFADGNVKFGTGEVSDGVSRLIDRGDAIISEEEIKENLDIYQALIDAGVSSIMISHSALNGVKMHENVEYISYLKNEMGFEGMIVSDWDSIHNCSGSNLKENVINCVNAGIDMLMEPEEYSKCRYYIVEGVNEGYISEERIDDAVTRILDFKIKLGLFDDPFSENLQAEFEILDDHSIEVARTLAAESFVPIKADGVMTIEPGTKVFVAGPAAEDTGVLCGGWTYCWTGGTDKENYQKWDSNSLTILEALQEAADENGFEIVTDKEMIDTCDMVLLCVGEMPYAEWTGDTEDLSITGALALDGNSEAISFAKESGLPTTALIVAGRNVIVDEYIADWDNAIMCYLPGTEGAHAIADVLTGKREYTGTLPMPYYKSVEDIEGKKEWLPVGYSAVQ